MSRILFAWELGGNLGHLSRQLPIAMQLRQRGHDVFFVSRDTAVAAQLLDSHGFAYTQAPFDTVGKRLQRPPINYAEMLIASGYGDPVALLGLVRSWLNLIRLFKADLIVVDHAPTALFAARLAGLPAIPVGTGFEIPPDHTPLPSIRPWETIPDARLLRAEEFVLERLNALTFKLGGRQISRITDLFQATNKLLATFAELDHYGVRAGETYVGPLFWNAPGQVTSWSEPDKPHLFAYLRPSLPGFENLLKAISKLKVEAVVVAPGIPAAQAKAFARPGFRIHTQPVQMDCLLKSADIAITTGGTGTVSQCLLAGLPLLLVPQNVEQYLMALRVEELGAGLAVRHKRQEENFKGLLEDLLQIPSYRQAAGAFAKRYAGFNPEHVVDLAVQLIEDTLKKPNDRLDGAGGADTLVGGAGDDTYIVGNALDVVVENANEGSDFVQSSVTYTLSANVENLILTGTAAIKGTGNENNNTLIGNGAANTLNGGAGADTLVGDAGNDTYIVDNALDIVVENANEGTDTVQASVSYILAANVENLTLTGTDAVNGIGAGLNNVLIGNAAANTLDGGAGADTMAGGGGDTYIVDNVLDVVAENANEGIDTVQSSVTYALGDNVENLTLTGAAAISATGGQRPDRQ